MSPSDVMRPRRGWCLSLAFFSLALLSAGQQPDNASADSLDSVIRDHAFEVLVRRHTGVFYQVPLPANLSGIGASVIRLRSASLWSRGANSTTFRIPPRIMLVPYVRRLVIVYQDMGNWSSSYYNVPGYSLVAPVVGLLAYDALSTSSKGVRELDFRLAGDPISITYPQVALPKGMNATIKCARFGPNGTVKLANATQSNQCSTTSTGHFAIVVPSVVSSPPLVVEEGGGSRWRVWLIACVAGVVGLVLLGLVGVGIFRLVRNKKMRKMESQAEEGEAFGTIWAGGSKMPSAPLTRTQPVIENDSAP